MSLEQPHKWTWHHTLIQNIKAQVYGSYPHLYSVPPFHSSSHSYLMRDFNLNLYSNSIKVCCGKLQTNTTNVTTRDPNNLDIVGTITVKNRSLKPDSIYTSSTIKQALTEIKSQKIIKKKNITKLVKVHPTKNKKKHNHKKKNQHVML